jgi:SulP family sulfate permease
VQGPLFFGAAQRFEEALGAVGKKPRAIILRIRDVHHIDATGLHALEQISHNCRRMGSLFILVGVHMQPKLAMEKSGLAEKIGSGNMIPTMEAAIRRLEEAESGASEKAPAG